MRRMIKMAPKKKPTPRRKRRTKIKVEEEPVQEALPEPVRTKNTKDDIEMFLSRLGNTDVEAAEYLVESLINNTATKYKPQIHIREVMVHLAQGKSMLETAYDMGFCINTFNRWRRDNPDFEKAVNIGKSLAEGWWQKKGRENIGNPYFNQQLWMMNMANRYYWTRSMVGREESVLDNEMDRYDETKKKYEGQKTYKGNIEASEVEELLKIIKDSTNTNEITVQNDYRKESTSIPGVKVKMDKIHPKRKSPNT